MNEQRESRYLQRMIMATSKFHNTAIKYNNMLNDKSRSNSFVSAKQTAEDKFLRAFNDLVNAMGDYRELRREEDEREDENK